MTPATDPRRPALNAYIRRLADAMRLQAWDIEVGDREPEDDVAILATDPDLRRQWAPIFVRATSFYDESPKEQRHDLVHELVHVVMTPMWLWVHTGSWRNHLSPRESELVDEVFREYIEQATDTLARLIAPSLPMPPEGGFSPTDSDIPTT